MQDVAARLRDDYDERIIWIGRTPYGTVEALYAAPSGSWTRVEITPDGTACLLSAGVGWQVPGRAVET